MVDRVAKMFPQLQVTETSVYVGCISAFISPNSRMLIDLRAAQGRGV